MPGFFHLRYRFGRLVPALLLFLTWANYSALCQFPINPATNVPICTAIDGQSDPVIVGDGAGGAFIAWNDLRSGQGFDIYMQHINAQGVAQWDSNGIVICAESGIQDMVVMVSDGAGGAILAWEDKRTDLNYDIYAQRVNATGSALWSAGGIPVITADGDQQSPSIVPDDQGGAIIAWNDTRPGGTSNIYAQRLDASGNRKWAVNGVPILNATVASIFDPPAMIRDGKHGAIVGWVDARNSDGTTDIYAQRVDADGTCKWDTLGTAVCLDPANQEGTRLAPDGAGGAIVGWTDWRAQSQPNGVYGDDGIYAQHADSAGGAIFAWEDKRKGTEYDIYAQRIDSSGAAKWDSAGIPVCTAFGDQESFRMASDSSGGVFIAWDDNRAGSFDIFATRISDKGAALWPLNGVAITTADGPQLMGHLIFNKRRGGIVAWTDGRGGNAGSSNIYAQNIDLAGYLGLAPALVSPKNGSVISTDSVRLVWNPLLPKPTRYWLEFGLDSAFNFRSTDSTITDTFYVARNLSAGHSYWWKVRGYDNGAGPFSAVWKVAVGTGVSGVENDPAMPKVFALEQNYPNPFNPTTVVRSQMPEVSDVRIVIYDVLGREVKLLVNERRAAGYYEDSFDASGLASGVYIYRLTAGSFVQTRKMVLLK